MSGTNYAKASYNESVRQYNEQQAQATAKKARDKANASSSRSSSNQSYANTFTESTNLNASDATYSLLNTAGVGVMESNTQGLSSTLGG